MDNNITKEAHHLFKLICKEYNARLKSGVTKTDANYFDDSENLKELLSLELSVDDISHICWELHRKGYLICHPGDDLANDITITDEGIAEYENRAKDHIKSAANVLEKIFHIIPH